MARVEEFRIALTARNYSKTLAFYRDVLGLTVLQEWPAQEGKGSLLSLGKATLEILDDEHARWVDRVEVGRRLSGAIRFAMKFTALDRAVKSAVENGARLVHEPVLTSWKDLNARLEGPDGMQMTFFCTGAETSS